MKLAGRAVAIASLIAVGSVAVAIPLILQPARAEEPKASTTQATMRGIFLTLTTAYQYSLDPQAFQNPANHERVLSALRALSHNAADLDQHGAGLDPSLGYLGRSLAKDAREAQQRFEEGQYMGSRFMLNKLLENCVTCHTKLPASKRFDVGEQFIQSANIQKLPPAERVNIQIAIRQFDAALKTYEEMFRDPGMNAERLTLLGAFEAYLKICISVLDNTARPIRTLKRFSQRTDMPKNMTELSKTWIASLEKLDLKRAEGKELEVARDLIHGANVQTRFPVDRTGLVDFVAASAVLHRYLKTAPKNKAAVAEAYYLLGVAESFISRSYWISETDFLLEKAVREDPKSPIAKKAYAFLREYTLAGYAAVGGVDLPPEVRENLDELRRLIEN